MPRASATVLFGVAAVDNAAAKEMIGGHPGVSAHEALKLAACKRLVGAAVLSSQLTFAFASSFPLPTYTPIPTHCTSDPNNFYISFLYAV